MSKTEIPEDIAKLARKVGKQFKSEQDSPDPYYSIENIVCSLNPTIYLTTLILLIRSFYNMEAALMGGVMKKLSIDLACPLLFVNKFVLAATLVTLLTACAEHVVWVAPKNTVSYLPNEGGDITVPIYMLGEDIDFPNKIIGHIMLSNVDGLTADTLPLNYKSDLTKEARKKISSVGSEIGADAVIDVTQAGYWGMNYASQWISGIAVKYVDGNYELADSSDRQEFIACVLPLVEANEMDGRAVDQDIRIKVRHFLMMKGYYVLTPPYTEYSGAPATFAHMSNEALDNLCGRKADLYVVLHRISEPDSLSISVFSKKERRLIIDGDEKMRRGGSIVGLSISAGLIGGAIGALIDNSVASETMIKNAIDPMPDIYVTESDLINKYNK